MLFDSHKDVVSEEVFGFWQYFGFSGGKLGPKMDQKPSALCTSCFHLTLNFERLFKNCFCFMKDVPLVEISANSSHICRRKGRKTSQKEPFHGCCIATKTFENL